MGIGKTALVEAEEDEEFPIPERLGILRSFQTVLTLFPKQLTWLEYQGEVYSNRGTKDYPEKYIKPSSYREQMLNQESLFLT